MKTLEAGSVDATYDEARPKGGIVMAIRRTAEQQISDIKQYGRRMPGRNALITHLTGGENTRKDAMPLETFTEWQLEDALHPPKRSGPRPESKWKPPKDTPFKRTFGKGQKIRPPKKGDGN